jgi:hypothetical protein
VGPGILIDGIKIRNEEVPRHLPKVTRLVKKEIEPRKTRPTKQELTRRRISKIDFSWQKRRESC